METREKKTYEPIHIVLGANHRYMPGLLVTMSSITHSASEKNRLFFHVLSDGLSYDDKETILSMARESSIPPPVFIEPDMSEIRKNFSAYKGSHTAFIRLFICDLMDLNWILYTDVDTLWMRDVSELWSLRDPSVSLLWCKDLPSICQGVKQYSSWAPDLDVQTYACSGVMLMNLKRLRENDFPRKCIQFVEKWGTPFFVDQDILNSLCLNDAKLLPQYWDCMMPTKEAVNGLVYHFNGIGSMFNGQFSGWRPLYYPWFRYYYDTILKMPRKPVCGFFKRFVFWLLGSFYPSRRLISIFFSRTDLIDSFQRQFFFAWLWRHRKWNWHIDSTDRRIKAT